MKKTARGRISQPVLRVCCKRYWRRTYAQRIHKLKHSLNHTNATALLTNGTRDWLVRDHDHDIEYDTCTSIVGMNIPDAREASVNDPNDKDESLTHATRTPK